MGRNKLNNYRNEIRKYRFLNNEMTQDELGRLLGLSRQSICEIETGKRTPSLLIARKIAKLLNTSIESIFFPDKNGN
jgi:putative transcriptional regulator